MQKDKLNKNDLKIFVIVLVFALCALSVLSSKLLIPAVLSIIIILSLYFFNILKKTDLEEKEMEIEELLLLTLFFSIYSIYSANALMQTGGLTPLFLFLLIAVCLFLVDVFKGLNVFFSAKRAEIYFRVFNPEGKIKMLFLGDSIIMNQGVQDPRKSLEGLFMEKFPKMGITSVGLNGLTTRGLLELLKKEKGNHYNIAIVSTGGNDITIVRSLKKIKQDISKLLDELNEIADHIVFIFSYDIGRAPLFSKTFLTSAFSKYYITKSERLIEILLELKETRDFLLVNLNDPSLGQDSIKKFYDKDLVHPNEKGYHKLYEEISALLRKKEII